MWGVGVLRPLSGIPLFLMCLAFAFYFDVLPSECYEYSNLSPGSLLQMTSLVVFTDIVQCMIHILMHTKSAPRFVRHSHSIHHRVKNPTPNESFQTGIVDSLLQLLLPLYISLWVVRPCRVSAIIFGSLYSAWLVYIHSQLPDHPFPNVLVTPSHHARHHESCY